MTVYTSDVSNAGTDAKVFLTLYGSKGKTDEVILVAEKTAFEKGSVDTFRLDMEDVGLPYKLRIRHDDSGASSGWHLDKVRHAGNGS